MTAEFFTALSLAQEVDLRIGAVAVLLLLAGCSGSQPPEAAPISPGVDVPSTPAPTNETPPADSQPPTWVEGQWWTWKLQYGRGPARNATTGVVKADPTTYSIGATDLREAAAVYPFHLIALGPVDRATLAWQAHGSAVRLLQFPLTDGLTFTHDFWSAPGATVTIRKAEVTGPTGREPGFNIEVLYGGATNVFMKAAWSTPRGSFVKVETYFGGPAPFASATLLEQGNESSTPLTPFQPEELLRWAAAPPDVQPRQITIRPDHNLVIFACFLGGAPGFLQAQLVDASNTFHHCARDDHTSTALDYSVTSFEGKPGSATVSVETVSQGRINLEVFGVNTKPG